ncbi:RNA 2',3'-cyclic phosphodiesterase [Sphingomonas sp.]|uniref:RNA 2',3'-cyclic phosphodiesterase n=1 Tax=Sphingomonas sp. TaxID=28214 RepID=UPI002B7ADF52|nr:RNA 2',3'-cyclic phosphodiesterase [Sphingomonas sp.]HTG37942.1 RNA 2',3'-cyclic phosphodiesterase [Sphingomonas sp.]
MHRLFAGLRPPPAIRQRLAGIMHGVPGARWQGDDQLHITLRFIGQVDRRAAEDAAHALAAIRFAPLSLHIAGVGGFDVRGRPNALWAGIQPRDAIGQLHRKIDQALVRIGLEPEHRAYLPHITLARLGRSAGPVDRWLADHAGLATDAFDIDAMILFKSHLGREGALYEAVERYPLTG